MHCLSKQHAILLFQSRNGLIWTLYFDLFSFSAISFQSRNGLIWTRTNWWRSWVFINISIPQRSDLNIWRYRYKLWYINISIPQRSDLNDTVVCDDNVTVVSFQSRNGLIWTQNLISEKSEFISFQSRNGLIWTHQKVSRCSAGRRDFNPATVWFELQQKITSTESNLNFNPATVWFEQCEVLRCSQTHGTISIPQRSDLNLSCAPRHSAHPYISIPQRSDLNAGEDDIWFRVSEFQSRNGLIWTMLFHVLPPIYLCISIPQRSDLNASVRWLQHRWRHHFNPATVWFEPFSIIWNVWFHSDFNPATVWFEPQRESVSSDTMVYFNPATVWFEHHHPLPPPKIHTDFNPATVWFELKNFRKP